MPQASNGQVSENGSIWFPAARLSNLSSDQRARNVDDVVTIVVQESRVRGQHRTIENFTGFERRVVSDIACRTQSRDWRTGEFAEFQHQHGA